MSLIKTVTFCAYNVGYRFRTSRYWTYCFAYIAQLIKQPHYLGTNSCKTLLMIINKQKHPAT